MSSGTTPSRSRSAGPGRPTTSSPASHASARAPSRCTGPICNKLQRRTTRLCFQTRCPGGGRPPRIGRARPLLDRKGSSENSRCRARPLHGAASSREEAMTIWIHAASSLVFAAVLAASGSAVAQQAYPDLNGAWIGQMQHILRGKTEHLPGTEETGPVFVEVTWTIVIDRQEGNRFTGTWGGTAGTRGPRPLGGSRAARTTIH